MGYPKKKKEVVPTASLHFLRYFNFSMTRTITSRLSAKDVEDEQVEAAMRATADPLPLGPDEWQGSGKASSAGLSAASSKEDTFPLGLIYFIYKPDQLAKHGTALCTDPCEAAHIVQHLTAKGSHPGICQTQLLTLKTKGQVLQSLPSQKWTQHQTKTYQITACGACSREQIITGSTACAEPRLYATIALR